MPNKNKVMFRKAYNTLLQGVSSMINDDANYPETQTGNDSSTTNLVQAGFNYETGSTVNLVSGTTYYYNKFCYLFFDQLNTVSGGPTSCPATTGVSNAVKTSDGITWYVYVKTADVQTFSQTYSSSDSFPRDTVAADCSPPTTTTACPTTITMDVDESGKSGDTDCSTVALTNPTVSACGTNKPDTFQVNVRYDGKVFVLTTDTNAQTYLSSPSDNS